MPCTQAYSKPQSPVPDPVFELLMTHADTCGQCNQFLNAPINHSACSLGRIAFGIGRYQPHAADDVLTNNYGDCKDRAGLGFGTDEHATSTDSTYRCRRGYGG